MNKAIALLGLAAVVGAGYVIGKKLIENNPEAVATVKSNCEEKLHKASVMCAGAVKTGSEKISESVEKIVAASREKGEEIVKKVKTTGTGFKNEIENLKDMVTSINNGAEVDISDDENISQEFTTEQNEAASDSYTFEQEQEVSEIVETPEDNSEAL